MNEQPLDSGSASVVITMPDDPVICKVRSRTKPFMIKDVSATDSHSASKPKTRDDSQSDYNGKAKGRSSAELEEGGTDLEPVDHEFPSIKQSTFEPPHAGPGTSTSAAPVDGNTGPLEENHGRSSCQVEDEPDMDFHDFEDVRQVLELERHVETALGPGTSAGAAGRFEDVGRPMPTEAAGQEFVNLQKKMMEMMDLIQQLQENSRTTSMPPKRRAAAGVASATAKLRRPTRGPIRAQAQPVDVAPLGARQQPAAPPAAAPDPALVQAVTQAVLQALAQESAAEPRGPCDERDRQRRHRHNRQLPSPALEEPYYRGEGEKPPHPPKGLHKMNVDFHKKYPGLISWADTFVLFYNVCRGVVWFFNALNSVIDFMKKWKSNE